MTTSSEGPRDTSKTRRWLAILLVVLVLVVGGGIGAYYLSTADDRACEDFHEKLIDEYFPGKALDPPVRDRHIEAIYAAGRFTTGEGETITKPEGCEPPPT